MAVLGLLQRKSRGKHSTVRVETLMNVRKSELEAKVRAAVEQGASVYTDTLSTTA